MKFPVRLSASYKLFLSLLTFILLFAIPGASSANTESGVTIEFRLNLSKAVEQQIFRPDSDAVYLVLDHGFAPIQLVQGPDFRYTVIIQTGIDSADYFQYQYRINDTVFETVNRSFTAKPGSQTLTCWWNDDPANVTTFRVNMQYAFENGRFNPQTDTVTLLGTMNTWSGSPALLREGTSLVYTTSFSFDPGIIHRFKYRINADSSGLELLNKPDRIFRVPDTLLTIADDFDNYNPGKRLLTLNCNMEYFIRTLRFNPLSDYLDFEGNFNNWGANDVLFDRNNDSIFTVEKYLDTTWFHQPPLEFKFRINGKTGITELEGLPFRTYQFHDTIGLNPNLYTCFFNNQNPSVPTPPQAHDVNIHGLLIHRKVINGSYSYENVNGIPEGRTQYRWLRSDNAQGLNAVAIDSATEINYRVDTVDISKWLVFEVTPIALSGDSAVGKPVRVVTATNISAWDVGIAETEQLSFKIYPNPADRFIHVLCDEPLATVEIINMVGQTVKSAGNLNLHEPSLIGLPGMPPGFYLVKATGKGGETGFVRMIKK